MVHPYYEEALTALKNQNANPLNTLLFLNMPLWPPLASLHLSNEDLEKEINQRRDFILKMTDLIYNSGTIPSEEGEILIFKIQMQSGLFYNCEVIDEILPSEPARQRAEKQYKLAMAILHQNENEVLNLVKLHEAPLDQEIFNLSNASNNKNIQRIINESHESNKQALIKMVSQDNIYTFHKAISELIKRDPLLLFDLEDSHLRTLLFYAGHELDLSLILLILKRNPNLNIDEALANARISKRQKKDTLDVTVETLEERVRNDQIKKHSIIPLEDKALMLDAIKDVDYSFLSSSKIVPDEDCLRAAYKQGNSQILELLKKRYFDHLIHEAIQRNDPVFLKTIILNGGLDEENLDNLIMEAIKDKQHFCVNVLLESKNRNPGKKILEFYKHDNKFFEKLHTSGFNINSKSGKYLIENILIDDNLEAMQALVDAGFTLPDSEKEAVFKILVTKFRMSGKNPNFIPILELLIFKFNYIPGLQDQHFILDSIKDSPQAKQLLEWGFSPHFKKLQALGSRIGHVLGLSQNIVMSSAISGKAVKKNDIKVEGNHNPTSLEYLTEKLNHYSGHLASPSDREDFKHILDCFQFTYEQYTSIFQHKKEAPSNLLAKYRSNELTHLTSGWPGHSVGITLYKGYLIYCNRGEDGDQQFGTKIFKIKDNTITEEWIKKLFEKSESIRDFHQALNIAIDESNPIAAFPAKGQKHGTCSYVNKLSSIEGMLCLLEAERQNIFTNEGIRKIADDMSQPEKRNQGKYKQFTGFCRDSEVDDLIKKMKNDIESDPTLADHYYKIFKEIIINHYGKTTNPIKSEDEKRRAYQLFNALPKDDQIKIRQEFHNRPEIILIFDAPVIQDNASAKANAQEVSDVPIEENNEINQTPKTEQVIPLNLNQSQLDILKKIKEELAQIDVKKLYYASTEKKTKRGLFLSHFAVFQDKSRKGQIDDLQKAINQTISEINAFENGISAQPTEIFSHIENSLAQITKNLKHKNDQEPTSRMSQVVSKLENQLKRMKTESFGDTPKHSSFISKDR